MKKTNDLKKGDRIWLRNGFQGTIADNLKGIRRMVDVEGHYKEIGSVYAFDIMAYKDGEKWFKVQHTKEQLNRMKIIRMAGF